MLGVYEYACSNTFSKSVCLFSSRSRLSSVRSVTLGAITPLVPQHLQSHQTMLGVCEYVWSKKHQHMLKVGLCILMSAQSLGRPCCDPGVYLITFVNTRRCSVCTNTHGHQSTKAFSKSVCVFLSRSILNSVRPVPRVTVHHVSHHLWLHETMLVCTSKHGHQSTNTLCQSRSGCP
jgi:hypothetical protein